MNEKALKRCPECGNEINKNDEFCSICGKKIGNSTDVKLPTISKEEIIKNKTNNKKLSNIFSIVALCCFIFTIVAIFTATLIDTKLISNLSLKMYLNYFSPIVFVIGVILTVTSYTLNRENKLLKYLIIMAVIALAYILFKLIMIMITCDNMLKGCASMGYIILPLMINN